MKSMFHRLEKLHLEIGFQQDWNLSNILSECNNAVNLLRYIKG